MALTSAQRKKIYLVSDTVLYPEAVMLIKKLIEDEEVKQLPKKSQLMGLLNIIKSAKYDDVLYFIKRQITRNVDEVFYAKILQELGKMQKTRLQDEFQLVIPLPTKREEDAEKKELMLQIAREFILHIIAEADMHQEGKWNNG